MKTVALKMIEYPDSRLHTFVAQPAESPDVRKITNPFAHIGPVAKGVNHAPTVLS